MPNAERSTTLRRVPGAARALRRHGVAAASAMALVAQCALLPAPLVAADERVPTDATQIRPLLIGAPVPDVTLRDATGAARPLRAALGGQPTVLVFYRGGWCMFCNTQLGQLQEIHPQLAALGYRIVGVSPDRPEKLRASVDRHGLRYSVLSDSSMAAARAFGIAFEVDTATVTKYRDEYKIDLEADSGQDHHQLPVASVFLVDAAGRITFSYVNPDYKVRVPPAVILAAAKASPAPAK
jgi:peroxiredoxin